MIAAIGLQSFLFAMLVGFGFSSHVSGRNRLQPVEVGIVGMR